jgi:hypothetical protein
MENNAGQRTVQALPVSGYQKGFKPQGCDQQGQITKYSEVMGSELEASRRAEKYKLLRMGLEVED